MSVNMGDPALFSRTVTLQLEQGLHIRVCSVVVSLVVPFDGPVTIRNGDKSADASSMFDLLQQGVFYNRQMIFRQRLTRDMLLERLERIRLPATALTRQTKNRVGEARINKMCNEFKDTVTQHLDPDRIDAFQTEIRELKQASGAN